MKLIHSLEKLIIMKMLRTEGDLIKGKYTSRFST